MPSDVVTVSVSWAWLIGTLAALGLLILLLEIVWTCDDLISRWERRRILRRLARKASTR
jgi:hypothetical protein